MSAPSVESVLQAAAAEGIVPAGTTAPAQDHRPWPIVLLMGLGAWLAALPLVAVVALLLSDVIREGAGTFVVGVAALLGAIWVLRLRGVPIFIEQLAIPLLIVGAGLITYGLYRDLPAVAASLVLAALAIAAVGVISQPWLRVILGASAAALLAIAVATANDERWMQPSLWWAWHLDTAVLLAAAWLQGAVLRGDGRAAAASALESLLAGWALATLAGLAVWAGMTFLVGASFGGSFSGDTPGGRRFDPSPVAAGFTSAASFLLAAAAAAWTARRWPSTRRVSNAGVAVVLIALAWLMPTLGAVLLILAHAATSGRWRIASAAALAAAWVVGAFYYSLAWPLSTKAAVLASAGVVLGAFAAWGLRAGGVAGGSAVLPAADAAQTARHGRDLRLGIAATIVLVLVVVNFGVWQKESIIAHGRPIYLQLAPVDPRSLMQGDYMSLEFAMPREVSAQLDNLLADEAPVVVAKVDASGVATVARLDDGAPLAADEVRIVTVVKGGRRVLVTDAWFFAEGDAVRFAGARFGEMRVDAEGHALLVGLRDANLRPL